MYATLAHPRASKPFCHVLAGCYDNSVLAARPAKQETTMYLTESQKRKARVGKDCQYKQRKEVRIENASWKKR